MKKRILSYMQAVDALLSAPDDSTDWESKMKEHLVQIQFFQHERLIHLIVTVTFAILQIITLGYLVNEFTPLMALLFLLILTLLIPYVAHYYLLENGVQHMYEQYDQMLALSKKQ